MPRPPPAVHHDRRIGHSNHESTPQAFNHRLRPSRHSLDFRPSRSAREASTARSVHSASVFPPRTPLSQTQAALSPNRRPLRSREVPQRHSVSLTETRAVLAGGLTRRSSRWPPGLHLAHGLPSPASLVLNDPLDRRGLRRDLHEAQFACTMHADENLHCEDSLQEPRPWVPRWLLF